jgi:hypothetical protein
MTGLGFAGSLLPAQVSVTSCSGRTLMSSTPSVDGLQHGVLCQRDGEGADGSVFKLSANDLSSRDVRSISSNSRSIAGETIFCSFIAIRSASAELSRDWDAPFTLRAILVAIASMRLAELFDRCPVLYEK